MLTHTFAQNGDMLIMRGDKLECFILCDDMRMSALYEQLMSKDNDVIKYFLDYLGLDALVKKEETK